METSANLIEFDLQPIEIGNSRLLNERNGEKAPG
jgi:hypothetical protein